MLSKRKLKSIELIEIVLVVISILLLVSTLSIISRKILFNDCAYNFLIVSTIFIATVIISIVVFLFVKRKYIEALKSEIEEDFDEYRAKLEEKVLTTNNRIFGFETNYSKKLKKVMKDYNIKVKEIERIKKELNIKLSEEDRKIGYLEIEICKIKLDNLLSKELHEKKEIDELCGRIILLNDLFPGISDEKFLDKVRGLFNIR